MINGSRLPASAPRRPSATGTASPHRRAALSRGTCIRARSDASERATGANALAAGRPVRRLVTPGGSSTRLGQKTSSSQRAPQDSPHERDDRTPAQDPAVHVGGRSPRQASSYSLAWRVPATRLRIGDPRIVRGGRPARHRDVGAPDTRGSPVGWRGGRRPGPRHSAASGGVGRAVTRAGETRVPRYLARDRWARSDRVGEPAANPYFYMASQVVAGLDGMGRRLDPGDPEVEPYAAEHRPLRRR